MMHSSTVNVLYYVAGEDFSVTTLTVDIHPNDTMINATIPILDDAIPEDVEVFHVLMSSSSEFVLVERPIAIVHILDEDGMYGTAHCYIPTVYFGLIARVETLD